jgi:carbon-monoxide dehydrogenase small subunit
MLIKLQLNGRDIEQEADGGMRAIDFLREKCNIIGPKEGCGSGECGACAVWIDGVTKLSCLMLAAQLHGRSVTTVEGLGNDTKKTHPVQQGFAEKGAVQCGFCTPGMVMTAADLLRNDPEPGRDAIREALSGNLCRCTGYHKIVDGVQEAARIMREQEK